MHKRLLLAGLAVAFGLSACQDSTAPSQPPERVPPQFVISDGAHGGNSHFYFLPPLVPEPEYSGLFDSTLNPTVKVCRLPACAADLFTFDVGSRLGEIQVTKNAYRLDWHTRRAGLIVGATYRLRVYTGTQLLGYLDLRLLERQGRPNPLPAGVIGLKQGHLLRLRFRIERGAVHEHGDRIAFLSTRDGNIEIYAMNRDGSNERRLTDNPTYDHSAAWSPDGTQLAFVSNRVHNDDVFIMNADGPGVINLTHAIGTLNNAHPAWSPDGRTIAFHGDYSGSSGIWLMSNKGAGARQVTKGGEDLPTWSPDGTRLAIRWQGMVPVPGGARSESRIIVINADGSNPHQILNTFVSCPGYMDWSPDGQQIAFDECFGASTLSLIHPDGSQLMNVNLGGNHSQHFSWSPDGGKLTFWHSHESEGVISDIYVINSDGTEPERLTDDPAYDFDPAWSP